MRIMNNGIERRRPYRPGSLAVTFLAGTLLLAGCEGDNLFSGAPAGRANQGPPVVTSISAPTSVAEGNRLDVRVKAIAPAGMQKVDVRFRNAVIDDQSFSFDGTRSDTVTVDASLNVPGPVQDSIIVIDVFATDRLGRVSDILSATVRVESSTLSAVTVSVMPSGGVTQHTGNGLERGAADRVARHVRRKDVAG